MLPRGDRSRITPIPRSLHMAAAQCNFAKTSRSCSRTKSVRGRAREGDGPPLAGCAVPPHRLNYRSLKSRGDRAVAKATWEGVCEGEGGVLSPPSRSAGRAWEGQPLPPVAQSGAVCETPWRGVESHISGHLWLSKRVMFRSSARSVGLDSRRSVRSARRLSEVLPTFVHTFAATWGERERGLPLA